MQVDFKVSTFALKAREHLLLHTKHIYEDIIDDEDEYEVAPNNSDIKAAICTVTKPFPETISVGKLLAAQAAGSQ